MFCYLQHRHCPSMGVDYAFMSLRNIYHLMILCRNIHFWKTIGKQSRIVFFGSGRVALPSLITLHKQYPNLQVVTQSSQGQKKVSNEVELYSKKYNLNWSSPLTNRIDKQMRKKEWTQYLQKLGQTDFGVVCSYGYMLPGRLIGRFRQGMIVVHPSLLPKYRGGAPIFHAVANGDTVSGVSYIEISRNAYDKGNVLHQVQCEISGKGEYRDIQKQLAEEGAKHLPFVLERIDELRPGRSQDELSQGVEQRLLSANLVKESKLDMNRPAQVVYNWSRALEAPRVVLAANQKEIIVKLEAQYKDGEGEVGALMAEGKKLFLRCSDRFVRVRKWYYPQQQEQAPGIFIAEFIRSGKYKAQEIKVY